MKGFRFSFSSFCILLHSVAYYLLLTPQVPVLSFINSNQLHYQYSRIASTITITTTTTTSISSRKRNIIKINSNIDNTNDERKKELEKDIDTQKKTSSSSSSSSSFSSSFYFIREAEFVDLNTASLILSKAFFAKKTNFFTFQYEKLKTLLSLESTFPKNNRISRGLSSQQQNQKHVMLSVCLSDTGKVIGFAELDGRRRRNSSAATTTTINSNSNSMIEDSSSSSSSSSPPKPYMCNLAIDSKYHRRGIATELIQHCEKKYCLEKWNESKMYLKVRDSNIPAIQLYESLGYTVKSVEVIVDDEEDEKEGQAQGKNKNGQETLLLLEKDLSSSTFPDANNDDDDYDATVEQGQVVQVVESSEGQ